MHTHYIIFSLIIFMFLNACSNPQSTELASVNTKDWLIPSNQVYDGGPGKDGSLPWLVLHSFPFPAPATTKRMNVYCYIKMDQKYGHIPYLFWISTI